MLGDHIPPREAMRHARDLPIGRRVAAYLLMLIGYFLYCYNFNTLDYVRPYLISSYRFGFGINAELTVVTNIAVTIGALCAASVLARLGRRISLTLVTVGIGLFAAVLALQQSETGWLVVRALLGLFLGAYYVNGVNLTVAFFPPTHRAKLGAVNSGMYSLSEIAIGLLGAGLGDRHWTWLLWLGALPLLLAPLLLLIVPADRSFVAYGNEDARGAEITDRTDVDRPGGWREMMGPRWRTIAILCALLAGLNYTGYQLFSSYVTVYLKQVRGFSAVAMGSVVAITGFGSLAGGFFWAFVADRYGRRLPGIGFLLAAAMIGLFLIVPVSLFLLHVVALLYGVGLAASYSWGIWYTEIFPARLRPYGTLHKSVAGLAELSAKFPCGANSRVLTTRKVSSRHARRGSLRLYLLIGF